MTVEMATISVGAHVELFKRDEATGKQMLVHTSRGCSACGQPVEGVVIPDGDGRFMHPNCRKKERA